MSGVGAFDTGKPDWTYSAVPAPILFTTKLPIPATKIVTGAAGLDWLPRPTHDAAWWEEKTKGFDFSAEDRIDSEKFNRILWEGIMGDKPYPTTRSGLLPVNITIDRSNGSVPGLYAVSGSERPGYVPGQFLTPAGGSTPNHWINPPALAVPANGTFGNLGRNAFRARGVAQLDLDVSKFVPIKRAPEHSVAGRPVQRNKQSPVRCPTADVSAANFGAITTTLSNYATGRGTPRELQLSMKIVF